MANSTGKTASGPGRSARRSSAGQHDPADAMEVELLQLWIGISRLRESLRDSRRCRPHQPAAARTSRRAVARLRRGHATGRLRRRPISSCE